MSTDDAPSALDDVRVAAIRRRDARADGTFWFGVKTTGIYCRPSCPARAARRENLRFFASTAAAERAGFRPCKRCTPAGEAPAARQAAKIARACRLISSTTERLSLAELAERLETSPFHLHRLFKAATGVTPRAYGEAMRAQRAQSELTRAPSVTAALHGAGYGSSSRFYERAGDRLGMSPRAYRAGGQGLVIRFAFGRARLGRVLVAATERGVCAILLGDDTRALAQDLSRRFPRATLSRSRALGSLVATVVARLDARPAAGDLPLDIQGTAFQMRVWQALSRVPAGATTTYGELARAAGVPRATRAVASACAANPLAVVIPCHRVVRGDGGLGGYRWGLARKRALLEREAADERT